MSFEILNQFEFLLGSIGVILSLFFGGFLLITYKRQPKANIFLAIYLLAFALRIGKSLFHDDFVIPAIIRTSILSSLYVIGPSLWLYSKYLKTGRASILSSDWLHFIPFSVFFCLSPFIPNDGTSSLFVWFYYGTVLSMFGYAAYALRWTSVVASNSDTEKAISKQRWLKYFLVANLVLVTIYLIISTDLIPYYSGIALGFSLLIVVLSIKALRFPDLFKVDKAKYSQSNISKEKASDLAKRLEVLIQDEKPYLDPELNLKALSGMLGASSKELSQVINQVYGINYAHFISQYRLAEAKRLLKSAEHQHLSIAAIAYDSGFNSISSFNSQFKKQEAMTAKDYRSNV